MRVLRWWTLGHSVESCWAQRLGTIFDEHSVCQCVGQRYWPAFERSGLCYGFSLTLSALLYVTQYNKMSRNSPVFKFPSYFTVLSSTKMAISLGQIQFWWSFQQHLFLKWSIQWHFKTRFCLITTHVMWVIKQNESN